MPPRSLDFGLTWNRIEKDLIGPVLHMCKGSSRIAKSKVIVGMLDCFDCFDCKIMCTRGFGPCLFYSSTYLLST